MPTCRPEATEGLGEQAASSNDSMGGSDKVEEQSTQGSRSKQDAAAASTDSTAASHESSPSLPPKSGAAELDASDSVGASSATIPAATSGPSSLHASNSRPDDSTPAEPLTGDDESAVADVQQADAAYGGNGSQHSRSDQASSPGTASWPGDRPAVSAGGDGSNGEHGDDDSRSVRSQDTTTSRASKIQASEMTRLQVWLAASDFHHAVTIMIGFCCASASASPMQVSCHKVCSAGTLRRRQLFHYWLFQKASIRFLHCLPYLLPA